MAEEILTCEEIESAFNECMTGGEAYKALERMLWKWYAVSPDELLMTLMVQLRSPNSQEDWALVIRETLALRKNGMRASLWPNEKIPMSECNCAKK